MERRAFLAGAGALAAGVPAWAAVTGQAPGLPAGALDSAVLDALPGKRALIKRSFRPPNYETPLADLASVITPNDAFFVRYHLAGIPVVDAAQWRLSVGGDSVGRPLQLDLASLQRDFEPVELTAVCLCSGNRRGLSDPHVPGVQWGYGAMGNARWRGVRLRDVLARAGLAADALEVVFDGADAPVLERTPDYVKSLPMWKALDENTLLAYAMNGEPLPHWNGFPVRLVVPGWTATYWIKHLSAIRVQPRPFDGFWMSTAYRIPKGRFPVVDRFLSQEKEANTPITEMVVNSLLTTPLDGARLPAGSDLAVQGVAWDAGAGIAAVDVSVDGGRNWTRAALGRDEGRYSFRTFAHRVVRPAPGRYEVMARASARNGTVQTLELLFNGAGYHNNVVQRLAVEVLGEAG